MNREIASMMFDSWSGLGRVVLVGALAYVALVAILRISGKRTLTKLSAFDFVVTVVLGSTLATVLLSKDVALAEGVVAMALLVFLQYVVTWASVRVPSIQRLIKNEPTLLVHRGAFLDGALQAQRVTRQEVLSVLRGEGLSNVERADAVVLETDGSFSVVPTRLDGEGAGTLTDRPAPANRAGANVQARV